MLRKVSSIPLLHGNVQLFPCGQPPTSSDTFAIKLLQSWFVREQGAVALPGLGGPLLATPGPCACHTPAAAPHPAWQQLTVPMPSKATSSICYGLTRHLSVLCEIILSRGMLDITKAPLPAARWGTLCHKSMYSLMSNITSRIQLT